ncbi:MAG: hypothetical protein Q8S73_03840, partial [Deltaproteobacteria bacterium]|nr:hypothetical protein [Deltaproteobacteria bacterium]
GGATGPLRSARTTALGAGDGRRALPLYVGVIASDDDVETPVWIEALGCGDPNGCTAETAVVAQRAVVRFTRGRTEEVPLLLASACVGVPCASDERCGIGGRCEPASRAQGTVRPFVSIALTGGEDSAVPDASMDTGSVADATLDAHGDESVVVGDADDVVVVKDTVLPVDTVDKDASDPDAGVIATDTGMADDVGMIDPPDIGGLIDVPVGGEDLGAPVDVVGPEDVDTPLVDAGPRCAAPLSECGAGPCVNTQTSAAHCGGCGRTCATGQSCVAGDCALGCAAPTTLCGGACVDFQTDVTHCGMCGRACAATARCVAGRCVGGVIPGASFQVGLSTNRCSTVDHLAVTGDDRGGIAVSGARLFYSGDNSTGRFDLQTLAGESLGRIYDGLVSDLATGTLYTLAIGSTPVTNMGGTITSLMELNPTTGGLTAGLINLSQPIPLPATGSVGIFSGYERIILMGGGRAWHVSLPSGAVIDLGAVAMPTPRAACENWAIWGVAEFYGGALYVDYVQSPTAIARMRVPEATVSALATFTALSDMCSFTVSPLWRRWYFHHEGSSQFRADGVETVGYCDATITGPTLPCRPIDTMCSGACTDVQTSAAHCGTCGRACAAGESCNAGVCGLACPAGRTACTGTCVDLNSDPAHCGACGRACGGGQWCIAGACGGGPNYAVDSSLTAATVPYVDACSAPGSVRLLQSADDATAMVTLPFATRWWGAPIASGARVHISSNGNAQLGTTTGLSTLSGLIPSTSLPNSVLAPQWADQLLSSTGVCVATVGTAPSRRWVVQWAGSRYYNNSNSLNYEVILHEGSGVIDFAYGAMSGVVASTVGIESPDGTRAFGPCASRNSCVMVSNARTRFTPIP